MKIRKCAEEHYDKLQTGSLSTFTFSPLSKPAYSFLQYPAYSFDFESSLQFLSFSLVIHNPLSPDYNKM